ncbi:MAG TPA: carboxypeptidase regulatory-like domain-containing protein, partial [Terracidiphilus sp.]
MRIRRTDAMASISFFQDDLGIKNADVALEHELISSNSYRTLILVVLILAAFMVPSHAQTISATLSGFVYDQTGAVVPEAKVTLINQASKDQRDTVSNGSGYFTFTAVPAATYSLKVTREGFNAFALKDIDLHPAEQRNLNNIKLHVGTVDYSITVTAQSSAIATSGERSALITANDINHLPVEGRDVTELIKTLPGFAQIAQGTGADNIAPDPGVVSGQTGNYTANGSSPEGISIMSDGVNITDPGNGGSSDQVINMDNVQEVQVQTSNFGADSAKGPVVINAVGKSGGSEYHGSLYVHGRTYQLNTQDWFSKYDQDAKPQDRYIYPGGNIGGPVKIPGTNFNHNKKLTFFAFGEDYVQKNVYAYGSAASATVNALLPTAAMRGIGNGGVADFSESSLTSYFGMDPGLPGPINQGVIACNANGDLSFYTNICNIPSGNEPGPAPTTPGGSQTDGPAIIGGIIPSHAIDPGAMAMVNNLMPLPNRTPFSRSTGGSSISNSIYNYENINLLDDASYQGRVRLDYAISDESKVYVNYDYQHSNGRNPQQLFYSPQQPFGEINTPSGILGEDFSHTASLNFTRVLSPSLTNEFYAGASLNYSHNWPGKQGSNLSSTIGYPYQGIYTTQQYPQFDDYGENGLPLALFPDYSSPIFQHKFVPNGGDNLTKVIKTHTIKIGGYLERATNNQTDLNTSSNGQIEQYYEGPGLCTSPTQTGCNQFGKTASGRIYEPNVNVGGNSTGYANYPSPGNNLAAFMLGEIFQFNQYNFQTNSDLYYWTFDGYLTDSWKATKRLNFDVGFRLGHVGPWEDAHGLGMAVWDPTVYASQITVTNLNTFTSSVPNPGFTWHSINKNIPNSGAGSTWAFFSPRFGVAY